MAEDTTGRWEQIRAGALADPATRERYDQTRRAFTVTRTILQAIEDERERTGLTKADLAQRVGLQPSAVRRLLTAGTSNPTLRTVTELLDAVGLELTLRRRPNGEGAGEHGPASSVSLPTRTPG
jgi:ribosome-binding protein aMBF1 (putative translation factor)